METISAWATGERRIWPHSMSSCHMSEEYANSPVTLSVPSGRSVDSPIPPAVWERCVTLNGMPVVRVSAMSSDPLAGDRRGLAGRGEPHRVHDLLVARAAAQGAGEGLADVRVGRGRGALQHLVGGDEQPGRAEAALHGARVDERLLDRGELGALAGLRVGALAGLPALGVLERDTALVITAGAVLREVGEALDGDDLAALDLSGGHQTRTHRHAV